MTEDLMRYDLLVESALRSVVRKALERAAAEGLPGDHHFYIAFRTTDPDVAIPAYLREKYPSEMTIVLQHQFRDLFIDDKGFSLSLSFNGVHEALSIPFSAIVAFGDPTVNFSLQFKFEETASDIAVETDAATTPVEGELATDEADKNDGAPDDNIVTLDQFRRK